ncbi:MAG: hypothetical protein CL920_14025 [Deltaproteobacteria bacterium]|nr:hypothetical protein [Deltaproteobacteria bacterium]
MDFKVPSSRAVEWLLPSKGLGICWGLHKREQRMRERGKRCAEVGSTVRRRGVRKCARGGCNSLTRGVHFARVGGTLCVRGSQEYTRGFKECKKGIIKVKMGLLKVQEQLL